MNKLCSAGLNVTDDHAKGVLEEAVGGDPAVQREALYGDGGQAVGGVEQADEPGHETTLDDIEDLLSGSDNDDLY